jgi:2-polyprenyl-3-methyl-5-hydroxy-6-metoxy-1,4-benzoquinol methylase
MAELRSRRTRVRKALERVPVLGPAMIRALRRGRDWVGRYRIRRGVPELRPRRFEALYKQRNDIADVDDIRDPVKRIHAGFALSTVNRGRQASDRLAARVPLRGKSYLDVGCAYGGFLVAFAEAGAGPIVGIDLDPALLDYARALLADHDVRARVEQMDLLAADRPPDLGCFDLITCNDVIEHVRDPRTALARLVSLLTTGGVLYMEIPNRYCASFVLSDGHYGMHGLTALPKGKADRHFEEVTGGVYDVTFKSLPFYVNAFAELGASSELISETPSRLSRELAAIDATFTECERMLADPPLNSSAESRASLDLHVRRLAGLYRRELQRYRTLEKDDPRAARRHGERMFLMFGCDSWTLLVRSHPNGAPRKVRWAGLADVSGE